MRKLFVLLALGAVAAGLLATSGSAATGSKGGSAATATCAAQAPSTVGRFGGIASPMSIESSCSVSNTSDLANGYPPLLWWGGPVMKGQSRVVVTPIFWDPTGHPMDAAYKQVITQYLGDVAAASGQQTNVFSTLNEYYGSNGHLHYRVQLGTPVNDTNPLPADGCILASKDKTKIYADGTGYNACLDDNQVTAEIQNVIDANNLPQNDYSHIYVMYLPKGVESCFYGGSTTNGKTNVCTINYEPTAGYCAYHSMMGDTWPVYGTVYANMPYPIYQSAVGYTCGTNATSEGFGGAVEAPNGNPDADTVISATSHEMMESITDPNVYNGWYDVAGYENGDECAYVWGPWQGDAGTPTSPGTAYNQVINGHEYLTQEEFSNSNFFATGLGCVQSDTPGATSRRPPRH